MRTGLVSPAGNCGDRRSTRKTDRPESSWTSRTAIRWVESGGWRMCPRVEPDPEGLTTVQDPSGLKGPQTSRLCQKRHRFPTRTRSQPPSVLALRGWCLDRANGRGQRTSGRCCGTGVGYQWGKARADLRSVGAWRRIPDAPIDPIDPIDLLNPQVSSATVKLEAPKGVQIQVQACSRIRWDSPRSGEER